MNQHVDPESLPPSKGVRYKIRRQLGEGGMATVYLAHDATLDREVVVKLPHGFLLKERGFAERFRREVRALVKLTHPHIVQILDVGEHDGGPFAVLQYLTGGTLEDLPNPLESLREWLPAIADALDYIHEQGYVHRDVKPSNILFDDRGNSFLADFGIVKAVSDKASEKQKTLTGTGMALGTPDYMAPELVVGQPFDGRADQYALAAVLYEIYSGEPVFAGATPVAIMMKHASDTPESLRFRDGLIPTALSDAIEQGLAKDPSNRYENCRALADSVLRANEAYLWAKQNRDSKDTQVHPVTTSVKNSSVKGHSAASSLTRTMLAPVISAAF
ncbi:MAG TPA: serine/threonine-protein kinase, partial [Pirellulaceae bacterium]|nr:serine/threonine-protein kinase [Pirellulaceae bacterium]